MAFKTFPASTIGVLVGRDQLGDALIKLPFIRALRAAYPTTKIHWMTTQGPSAYATYLREMTRTLIDEVWEQPAWLTGSAKNHPQPALPYFDLLIDTRNRWRLALAAKRTIPHGLFLSPALHHMLSDRRPVLWKARPVYMGDRLLQMVELAAGSAPPTTGRLPVSPELLTKARLILPEGPDYIGFAPGAGNPVKIWPLENFIKLAEVQGARGRIPVFLLGPQETSWHQNLKQRISRAKFPLQEQGVWQASQPALEHTLAIGCCLKMAVAHDSGTGHVLAAVDCPLISLFGPTSPAKLAPKVRHGQIIKAQNYWGDTMVNIPWQDVDKLIESFIQQA